MSYIFSTFFKSNATLDFQILCNLLLKTQKSRVKYKRIYNFVNKIINIFKQKNNYTYYKVDKLSF